MSDLEDLLAAARVEPVSSMLNGSRREDQTESRAGKDAFQILTFDEVRNQPPREFLVHGLVAKGDMFMLYGPPKSKKTLIMLDLLAAIVKGATFADYFDVPKPANVLYCYGEGRAGMPDRLRALEHKWQFSPEEKARFRLMDRVPIIVGENHERHIQNLVEYLQTTEDHADFLRGGLLVIDTFARATAGGNENDTADSGQMMEALDATRLALECSLGLNHHENKQGQMRGNSSIPGALDVFIQSRPDKDDPRSGVFHFDNGKDVGDFPDLIWRLTIHEWQDEQGQIDSSAYINWEGIAEKVSGREGKDAKAKIFAHLVQSCAGLENALTIPKLQTAVQIDGKPSLPTVRKYTEELHQENPSIRKIDLKAAGSGATKWPHYYHEPTQRELSQEDKEQ